MPMRLCQIRDKERSELRKIASSPGNSGRNARIVLMASEGMDSCEIAEPCGISQRTVRHIVKRFNDGGPDALRARVSPGRPRSITPSQREAVIALIQSLATERWTLADLVAIMQVSGIVGDVSSYTVRRKIIRILDEAPELRACVPAFGQSGAGAPVGNLNALKHGAYSLFLSEEDKMLADKMARRLRKDFPSVDKEAVKRVAEYFAVIGRAIASGQIEVHNQMDGRLRRGIQKLKALEEASTGERELTPAEWASDLLRRYNESQGKI